MRDEQHIRTTANSGLALAMDVGATKFVAAIVDRNGRMRGRARMPVPQTDDSEEFFEALVACAAGAMRGTDYLPEDLVGIGVACAGPMVWPTGVVSPLNIDAWDTFPLRDRLVEEFDTGNVLVHNNAIGMAVGEHWRGAGLGVSNMLAVSVSNGVGGGLVLNGRLHHGTSGNAGHFGHIVVEPRGPACKCGGRGCVEAVAAGPHIVERALAEGWTPIKGAEPDGRALAAAAHAGDEVAIRCLARSGRGVGICLASCVNALDLEVVVVAGGISRSGQEFWDPLKTAFAEHARMDFAVGLKILPSQIPDDAGLLGAAAFVLVPDKYGWIV